MGDSCPRDEARDLAHDPVLSFAAMGLQREGLRGNRSLGQLESHGDIKHDVRESNGAGGRGSCSSSSRASTRRSWIRSWSKSLPTTVYSSFTRRATSMSR